MSYNPLSSEEILENICIAGRKHFLQYGFLKAEMKKIADDAHIYRSTLYRYFPKKENLAFLVVNQLLFELSAQSHAQVDRTRNGYEQMCQFVKAYQRILTENPAYLRLFSDFDSTQAELAKQHLEESAQYAEDRVADIDSMAHYVKLGIEDGSIRSDTQPVLFTLEVFNAMFGIAQRVIGNGDIFYQQHHIHGEELLNRTTETLLQSIRQ